MEPAALLVGTETMTKTQPISELWTAYEAARSAQRVAYDRVVRVEQRYGAAPYGNRHPKVVIADAMVDELSSRLRDARKAILSRPVDGAEAMDVLRRLARDVSSQRHIPRDVRTALKAARLAGWRTA